MHCPRRTACSMASDIITSGQSVSLKVCVPSPFFVMSQAVLMLLFMFVLLSVRCVLTDTCYSGLCISNENYFIIKALPFNRLLVTSLQVIVWPLSLVCRVAVARTARQATTTSAQIWPFVPPLPFTATAAHFTSMLPTSCSSKQCRCA